MRTPYALAAALMLSSAAGGCAILAPFPDVAPDPEEPSGPGGSGAGSVCEPHTTRACYTGPKRTEGVGVCHGGVQACNSEGTRWGPCKGEVKPSQEDCSTAADESCDGAGCGGSHVESAGFGGAGEQRGSAVSVAAELVLAGQASGPVDFGEGELAERGSPSKLDGVLAAFDPAGTLRWSQRFSDCIPRAVAQSKLGDIILAGGAEGDVDFGGGVLSGVGNGEDVVLARFDSQGVHLWSRRVGNGANQFATAVAVDAAGNTVATGTFWGKLDFGPSWARKEGDEVKIESAGESDGFVVKLDADGETVWSLRFGDADNHQAGTAVAVDGQGNVVVAGWFKGVMDLGAGLTSTGETDLFVAKLSPAGDLLWVRMAPSTNAGKALGLAVDGAGNVVVVGSFRSSIQIGATTLTTAGDKDAVLIKLDENGTPLWARSFGDDADQEALGVSVDPAGNVLVTGAFLGRIGVGSNELVSKGAADAFLVKLDPGGDLRWARSFGDLGEQGGAAVAADALGNAWATGYFNGAPDFGGGAIQSRGASDIFLVALGP